MATLFEINESINMAIEFLFDEETGEINEDVLKNLEEITFERNEKLESYALIIKRDKAFKRILQDEKRNLDKRIKHLENRSEWLKTRLAEELSGEKFETGKVKCSFRKSKSVEIDPKVNIKDFAIKHPEYTKFTPSFNKTEIKKAIEKGAAIEGCKVRENNNLIIK